MKTQAFFENIQQIISSELLKSRKSIYVAVAWFTDVRLLQILEDKAKQGVKIKILFVADDINNQCDVDFSNLESLGGKIFPLSTNELLMHNKFCIIDNETVITGSYNWTNKAANSNLENIMLITGNFEVCEQYQNNFNKILSEYFDEDFSHEYHSRGKNNWVKYKFHNKEYANFKDLSIAFSESLIKWRDAQEHFKQGFIQQWLEEINDFDTIVQLNKAKSKTTDIECQLAYLTYFSNPCNNFSFLNIELDIKNIISVLKKSFKGKSQSEELYLIELIKNGQLTEIYAMFLFSKNKNPDSFSENLKFITHKNIDSLIRFFEWDTNSSDFIPFESIYYEDVEFLIKNKEVNSIKNKCYVPKIVLDKLYSSDRIDTLKAAKILQQISNCPKLEKEKLEKEFDEYILPKDFFEYCDNIIWEKSDLSPILLIIKSKSLETRRRYSPSCWGKILHKDANLYYNRYYFETIKSKLPLCNVNEYIGYSSQLVLTSNIDSICLQESPELLYGLKCDNEEIRKISFHMLDQNKKDIEAFHINYCECHDEDYIYKFSNYFVELYKSRPEFEGFEANRKKRRSFIKFLSRFPNSGYIKNKGRINYVDLIYKMDNGDCYIERGYNLYLNDNDEDIQFSLYFLPFEKSLFRFDKLGFADDTAIITYLKESEQYNDYLDINGNLDYIAFWWDISTKKAEEDEIKQKEFEVEEKIRAEERRKEEEKWKEEDNKKKYQERIKMLEDKGIILNKQDMNSIYYNKSVLEELRFKANTNYDEAYTKAIVFFEDIINGKKCSKDDKHDLINEIFEIVKNYDKKWFAFGKADKIGSYLEKIDYNSKYWDLEKDILSFFFKLCFRLQD